MIGFRSGHSWKMMLALIYYALAFLGFSYGVFPGVAILVVVWLFPLFVCSMHKVIKERKFEELYSVPVFIISIGLCAALFAYDANEETKTATTEASVVAENTNIVSFSEPTVVPDPTVSYERVYITKSGGKYHTEDCRFVKNKEKIAVSVEEARSTGKSACGVCLK